MLSHALVALVALASLVPLPADSPALDVDTVAVRLSHAWRWRVVDVPDDAHVARVDALPDDVLHVATSRGSYLYDGTTWSPTPDRRHPQPARSGITIDVHASGGLVVRDDEGAEHVVRDGPWRAERASDLAWLDGGRLAVTMISGRLLLCDLESDRYRYHSMIEAFGTNTVDSLAPARDGGLWVGTTTGVGLFRDGRVERVLEVPDDLADDGLHVRIVTALHEDPRGHVWVGSGSGFQGVAEFTPDGVRWHRHPDGTRDHCVHSIDGTRDGAVWFSLLERGPGVRGPAGGVARLRDGDWTRWTTDDGLPSDRVYGVAEAPDGTVIAATLAGLARLDGERWVRINGALDEEIRQVRDLAFDGDVLWGVYRRHGACVFRARWDRERLVDLETWTGPLAESILPDGVGGAWVTSNFGLQHVTNGGMTSVSPLDARPDAMWPIVEVDGELWLGKKQGLSRLAPDDVTPPTIHAVETTWSDSRDSVFVDVTATDGWLSTPTSNLLASWRVDDGPWSPARAIGESLEITDLAPGMRRVSVRASDAFGNVTPMPTSVWVDVEAPWYLAWPTRLGALVALAAAGAWWRERLRRRRDRAAAHRDLLEAQERERSIIAHEIHDGLGRLLRQAEKDIEQADGHVDEQRRDQLLHHAFVSCRTAAERVHDLSTRLRPRVLDELGLREALHTELDVFGTRLGVHVHDDLGEELDDLPPATASQTFRIVLEALANIERSAVRIDHLDVEGRVEDGRLVLSIVDDASRGGPRAADQRVSKERAESLGGSLTIVDERDGGRRLTLELPFVGEPA